MARNFGQSENERQLNGRLLGFGAFAALLLLVFLARLFQLQIIEGDEFARFAEGNRVRTERVLAPRGEIVDRDGRVLATTRSAHELRLTPAENRRGQNTIRALAMLLGEDAAALQAKAGALQSGARFRTAALARDLTPAQLARITEHGWALPGVTVSKTTRRHYAQGALAAHLLGRLGEIQPRQLEQANFAGYRAGEEIGQRGVEARYEKHLRGVHGGRNFEVDARGRERVELQREAPSPGGRVVLALDLDIQRAAEAGFAPPPTTQTPTPQGAQRNENGEETPPPPPKVGAAVALDVQNGDVLALASFPRYNPNAFVGGIAARRWRALSGNRLQPLRNRALQNRYPPASTHKAVTAAALLAEGVVTPHSTAHCPGYYRFAGRRYRCWHRRGHGRVNLKAALQKSCDVYFYHFGNKLGVDKLAKHAVSLGLREKSGINLDGEIAGLIPDSEWKLRARGARWYPGETLSAAIGQGYNEYTPLQLALAYAAIANGANGGAAPLPRLVLRLENDEGEVLREFPVRESKRRTLASPEVLSAVRDGLTAVVEEAGGTARRVQIPGVPIAGKTGTAQVVSLAQTEGLRGAALPWRYRDHAWFAAFAPAQRPRIAVAVFVEHGGSGSRAAAPIARRMILAWAQKEGLLQRAQTPQQSAEGASLGN